MVSVSLISFFLLLIIGMPVAHVVLGAATLGVLTGGLTASAGGITAAVVFGVLMALLFKPGDKR